MGKPTGSTSVDKQSGYSENDGSYTAGGSDPNAKGPTMAPVYSVYSNRFDDNYADGVSGEGQIHSGSNDGYPWPAGKVIDGRYGGLD